MASNVIPGDEEDNAATFGQSSAPEKGIDVKNKKSPDVNGSESTSLEDDPQEQGQVQDQDQSRDLELAPVQTNGPPHTVFTYRQKQFIVFMVAWGGFFSPLSANIYFPALPTLARDLNVSESLINLTLTSYMIFQGLAPTIFGDLGDMAGRRPAYIVGFVIYIGACVGCALQDSFASLFVLRCLQACGSSGTIALASGVVADIATSSERGTWMGYVYTPKSHLFPRYYADISTVGQPRAPCLPQP